MEHCCHLAQVNGKTRKSRNLIEITLDNKNIFHSLSILFMPGSILLLLLGTTLIAIIADKGSGIYFFIRRVRWSLCPMNSEMCFHVLKADLLRCDLWCTVNKQTKKGFALWGSNSSL